jgi:hypothetical protein
MAPHFFGSHARQPDYCWEFAFGAKAVARAGGRTLVFIHIYWISDHPLGRSATLENQPALNTKRGIAPPGSVSRMISAGRSDRRMSERFHALDKAINNLADPLK